MDRMRAHILREAAAAGSYKAARDKGQLIGAAWLRCMDLRVIEVRPMRLLESRREVIRLWCTARNGDEFCVYAEPYKEGNGPKLYDPIWWLRDWIRFGRDNRKVRKIGNSFDAHTEAN
jgi:hypothetical protein